MAYADFLEAMVVVYRYPSVDALINDPTGRHHFKITSRERALETISKLRSALGTDFSDMNVVDIGCAYGSFAIEFAKLGAKVLGIDTVDTYLRLAEANARDEVSVPFVKCDAATRAAADVLGKHGPFDLVILNDVLEHIYDTIGLFQNIAAHLKTNGHVYYKVPNIFCFRTVLLEGHHKIFGISLLAPDYWPLFTKFPSNIYYRRLEYFEAIFAAMGFQNRFVNAILDKSHTHTLRHLELAIRNIQQKLSESVNNDHNKAILEHAITAYIDELTKDMTNLDWEHLYRKYRENFWEGILTYQPEKPHQRDINVNVPMVRA